MDLFRKARGMVQTAVQDGQKMYEQQTTGVNQQQYQTSPSNGGHFQNNPQEQYHQPYHLPQQSQHGMNSSGQYQPQANQFQQYQGHMTGSSSYQAGPYIPPNQQGLVYGSAGNTVNPVTHGQYAHIVNPPGLTHQGQYPIQNPGLSSSQVDHARGHFPSLAGHGALIDAHSMPVPRAAGEGHTYYNPGHYVQSNSNQTSQDTNYAISYAIPGLLQSRTTTKCAGELTLTDCTQFYVFKSSILPPQHVQQHDEPMISFCICEECFSANVLPYPNLASNFTPLPKMPGQLDGPDWHVSYEKLACSFHFPRVRAMFYNICIPQNTIQPLVDFSHLDLEICNGTPRTGYPYSMAGSNAFACCTTCFELYIRYTSFEPNFQKAVNTSPNALWACDISACPYIKKTLLADLAKNPQDYAHFVREADKRIMMNACPGEGQPLAQTGAGPVFAFKAINGKSGSFCLACFHDYIQGTSIEPAFNHYFEIEEDRKANLMCDLAPAFSKFGMTAAIRQANDEVWRTPVTSIDLTAPCVGIFGVDESDLRQEVTQRGHFSNWYCVTDYPAIEICPRCYYTSMTILGAAQLCSRIDRPFKDDVIRFCFLSNSNRPEADCTDSDSFENTLVCRGALLRNTLGYAFDSNGNFAPFNYIAREIANYPPPCGSNGRKFKQGSGRKWLGHRAVYNQDDCTLLMCEECFLDAAKGSPLEQFLSEDLTTLSFDHSDGFLCNTYSKRVRSELRDACKAGDWASFARFWAKRNEVWLKYKEWKARVDQQMRLQNEETARMNAQNAMMRMNIMMQINNRKNAMIGSIGGSFAEAAATDTGYRYGNSTIGNHYLTSAGASAAQASHDAKNGSSMYVNFVPTGNVQQDTLNLIAAFEPIKAEWEAIE